MSPRSSFVYLTRFNLTLFDAADLVESVTRKMCVVRPRHLLGIASATLGKGACRPTVQPPACGLWRGHRNVPPFHPGKWFAPFNHPPIHFAASESNDRSTNGLGVAQNAQLSCELVSLRSRRPIISASNNRTTDPMPKTASFCSVSTLKSIRGSSIF